MPYPAGMIRVNSESLDPYLNLAAEDLLLDRVGEWGSMLMLWRCDRTVVIGKNQNPWRECDLPALMRDGGRLARRVSGGGAVYHDLGNLNYAWFCPRVEYDRGEVFDRVIEALGRVGVRAERMGRTSLGAGGRKVSGTAFCYRRDAVLHHGTLLIHADLDALRKYLDGTGSDIETRAVSSEPAAVVNLGDLNPRASETLLSEALTEAFGVRDRGACRTLSLKSLPEDDLTRRADELRDPEWVLGRTPPFTWDLHGADSDGADLDGPPPLRVAASQGRILTITGRDSAAQAAGWLEERLRGRRLTRESLHVDLDHFPGTAHSKAAWEAWINTRLPIA